MRIELVRRPQHSALFSALSPFIALALTLIAGVIIFSLLGKNPLEALYYYFIDPLREMWSLHELAIKAAPLILIAVGLSVCYLSNNWNIGAEGQFIIGAVVGLDPAGPVPAIPVLDRPAADAFDGHGGRGGLCGDSRLPEECASIPMRS
jgi:ABC-type uncharacterized transport system permease subunit